MEMQRGRFENGFQKWVFQGYSKTQGSGEIFKGMIKIKLGSLEK